MTKLSIATAALALVACNGEEPAREGTPSEFLAHAKKLAAEAGDKPVIEGKDGELLFVSELRSMGAGPFWGDDAQKANKTAKPDRRDPLPAILDVHEQMKAAGIDWVFVPVPAKITTTDGIVPGAPTCKGRVDVYHEGFYAKLREAGVPVLDIGGTLRALAKKPGSRAHCASDTHWSPAACKAVAAAILEHVGDKEWRTSAPKIEYRAVAKDLEFVGDMRTLLGQKEPQEKVAATRIEDQNGKPPVSSKESPILLFGDSHCLVFQAGGDMHADGCGLGDHLAHRFQMPIEVVGVRGSGATPSRVSVRRSGSLANKKLAIWCLSVREFTESSGWSVFALTK